MAPLTVLAGVSGTVWNVDPSYPNDVACNALYLTLQSDDPEHTVSDLSALLRGIRGDQTGNELARYVLDSVNQGEGWRRCVRALQAADVVGDRELMGAPLLARWHQFPRGPLPTLRQHLSPRPPRMKKEVPTELSRFFSGHHDRFAPRAGDSVYFWGLPGADAEELAAVRQGVAGARPDVDAAWVTTWFSVAKEVIFADRRGRDHYVRRFIQMLSRGDTRRCELVAGMIGTWDGTYSSLDETLTLLLDDETIVRSRVSRTV